MAFDVCIGNYGYYNEGELRDTWLTLPIEDDQLQPWLEEHGLYDATHEEIYISDYDLPYGLEKTGLFSEYSHFEELNMLAKLIDSDPQAAQTVSYMLETDVDTPESLMQLMNLIVQADEIPFLEWEDEDRGYSSPEERLSYQEIALMGGVETLDDETLARHFDYEMFGRTLNAYGFTTTPSGYLISDNSDIDEAYYDAQEIIEEAEKLGFDSSYKPDFEQMKDDFKDLGYSVEDLGASTLDCATHFLVSTLSADEERVLEAYSAVTSASVSIEELANTVLQVEDLAFRPFSSEFPLGIKDEQHLQLAKDYIKDIGGTELLDRNTLEFHFDYESYGRDIANNYFLGKHGYIYSSNDLPDMDYYDLDELREKIDAQWVSPDKPSKELTSDNKEIDRVIAQGAIAMQAWQLLGQRVNTRTGELIPCAINDPSYRPYYNERQQPYVKIQLPVGSIIERDGQSIDLSGYACSIPTSSVSRDQDGDLSVALPENVTFSRNGNETTLSRREFCALQTEINEHFLATAKEVKANMAEKSYKTPDLTAKNTHTGHVDLEESIDRAKNLAREQSRSPLTHERYQNR